MSIAFVLRGGESGLGVIRSLFMKGIRVYCLDHDTTSPGLSSRYCQEYFLIANPIDCPRQAFLDIFQLCEMQNEEVVLHPTTDYYAKLISEYEVDLAKVSYFLIPSNKTLNNIVNKGLQYKVLMDGGIPVPETFENIDEIISLRENISTINKKYIIKPSIQLNPELQKIGKGIIVDGVEELIKVFSKLDINGGNYIAQEYISPDDDNYEKSCVLISRDGDVIYQFGCIKHRQHPPKVGTGTYLESIDNIKLFEMTKKALELFDYRGVASIEYKYSNTHKKYFVIEINPRYWSQNYHATISGLNFSCAYHNDSLGNAVESSSKSKNGVFYTDSLRDFLSLVSSESYKLQKIKGWAIQQGKADVHAYWMYSDPIPSLVRILNYVTNYLNKIGRN